MRYRLQKEAVPYFFCCDMLGYFVGICKAEGIYPTLNLMVSYESQSVCDSLY